MNAMTTETEAREQAEEADPLEQVDESLARARKRCCGQRRTRFSQRYVDVMRNLADDPGIAPIESEAIRAAIAALLAPATKSAGQAVRSTPLLGGTSLTARDCYVIGIFCDEVERMAERNMIKTGKLEGAHYAAMRQLRATLAALGEAGLQTPHRSRAR
jgi:hypothetical protein